MAWHTLWIKGFSMISKSTHWFSASNDFECWSFSKNAFIANYRLRVLKLGNAFPHSLSMSSCFLHRLYPALFYSQPYSFAISCNSRKLLTNSTMQAHDYDTVMTCGLSDRSFVCSQALIFYVFFTHTHEGRISETLEHAFHATLTPSRSLLPKCCRLYLVISKRQNHTVTLHKRPP